MFKHCAVYEQLTSELSSRPEHDGFIIMRSGETCRLAVQALVPVQTSCRS